jgi:hypothetical protein
MNYPKRNPPFIAAGLIFELSAFVPVVFYPICNLKA